MSSSPMWPAFLPWLLCLLLVAGWLIEKWRWRKKERACRQEAEALQRLLQALDSASEAIGIGDMESNSLYHNHAHRDLFGYSVEELNACEEPAVLFADKEAAQVVVTVGDNGCGIPAEVLARNWEPFFTTKDKGPGLGLATTYSVIKQHGGSIHVTSESGRGTRFTVVLSAAGSWSP